ncbi:acyl-CoA synthetase [Haloferula sargassicola]|uniref:Long-chain-fatty-acid--CoA ligase n=1 Tax=Haloferula sargassicola TaxID=490096 RepID=A0ABP9UWL2_9BACT
MPPASEPPVVSRARLHPDRIAILDGDRRHTYTELLEASERLAARLLDGRDSLHGARVVFDLPAGFDYVAAQWAIWRAGGIAVPVSPSATAAERGYLLEDTGAEVVISRSAHGDGLPRIDPRDPGERTATALPSIDPAAAAMLLYTSGTTSRPKGVVSTHAGIAAQIGALCQAWQWTAEDRIPLFLPLHHIHGIINILGCALWSGASVETFGKFSAEAVLPRVAGGAYTLFMAVPTIYAKLSQRLEKGGDEPAIEGFRALRLMVSGSSALPPTLLRKWRQLTGQTLLERYGMTETGMILSNPYEGERRSGTVGQPVPGMEVRLVQENGAINEPGEPGEIQVRGPAVFQAYWERPEATAEAFVDGWFRTGDLGIREDGYFRILGRLSVDIIKSGGYKLSALEIEAAYLEHPAIHECAVVGVPDEVWGEAVAIAIVHGGPDGAPQLDELRDWGRERLSPYKLPRLLTVTDALPRNAMGKVAKREVARLFPGPADR